MAIKRDEFVERSELMELLSYDPETGVFTWKVSAGRCKAGSVAGSRRPDGYTVIRAGGGQYRAHRLAWLFVHGIWPTGEIDHVNRIRGDNRIENLRDVGHDGNMQNVEWSRGADGAYLSRGKFRSQIKVRGRAIHLGVFDSREEAESAYRQAKARHHPLSPEAGNG